MYALLYTLRKKGLLKGSLAVPIGEHFLVSSWNQKGFFKGFSYGDS